jgi:hypothetical protein
MKSNIEIKEQLNHILKIKKIFWSMFLGYIPFFLLLLLIIPGDYLIYLQIPYALTWAVLGVVDSIKNCPLCNEYLYTMRINKYIGGYNTLRRSCAHCGVKFNGENIDEIQNKNKV